MLWLRPRMVHFRIGRGHSLVRLSNDLGRGPQKLIEFQLRPLSRLLILEGHAKPFLALRQRGGRSDAHNHPPPRRSGWPAIHEEVTASAQATFLTNVGISE